MVAAFVGWVVLTEFVIGVRQDRIARQAAVRTAAGLEHETVPIESLMDPEFQTAGELAVETAAMPAPDFDVVAVLPAPPAVPAAAPAPAEPPAMPEMPGASRMPGRPAQGRDTRTLRPLSPRPPVPDERMVSQSAQAKPKTASKKAEVLAAVPEPQAEVAVPPAVNGRVAPVSVQRHRDVEMPGHRKVSPLFRGATY
jgi:hypothetical protein